MTTPDRKDIENAIREEIVVYKNKPVKKQDLANHLTDCMIQIMEILEILNLKHVDIEGDDDKHTIKIHVKVTKEAHKIQLIN